MVTTKGITAPCLTPNKAALQARTDTAGRFDPTVLGDVIRAGYDRSFDELSDLERDDAPSSALHHGVEGIEIAERFNDWGTTIIQGLNQATALFKAFDFVNAAGNAMIMFTDGRDDEKDLKGKPIQTVIDDMTAVAKSDISTGTTGNAAQAAGAFELKSVPKSAVAPGAPGPPSTRTLRSRRRNTHPEPGHWPGTPSCVSSRCRKCNKVVASGTPSVARSMRANPRSA